MADPILFLPAKYQTPDDAHYEHNLIALAEGLSDLGIAFGSASDYWKLSEGDFLLKKRVERLNPCMPVISHESFPFIEDIDFTNAVYIDSADGWRTPSIERSFPPFRLILRSHFNDHYKYSSRMHSWTFGLTSRIIEAARSRLDWEERSDSILFNFRAGHPLRTLISEKLIPRIESRFSVDSRVDSFDSPAGSQDYSYWGQTGRRHYPSYFQRLVSTKICATFGGYFSSNISCNLNSFAERLAYRFVFKNRLQTRTVMQWDSWRLWEAWAGGCVVLHVDFDKYGCCFPVQPKNWVHYVGFDLDDLETDIERFLSTTDDQLRNIAENGREWAITHYSPCAVAARFLSLVDSIE